MSAQALLAKAKATYLQIMSFQISCQKFYLERYLLKYKATKATACLTLFTVLHNRSTSEA